jgi:hypothetical protein
MIEMYGYNPAWGLPDVSLPAQVELPQCQRFV